MQASSFTGATVLDSFNIEKYVALAHMQPPRGIQLCSLVEENWQQWVDTVENATWLRNWTYSSLRGSEAARSGASEIAHAIYVTAVWGYGLDHWDPHTKKGAQQSMSALSKLQDNRVSLNTRSQTWDVQLQRNCGLLVPVEYAALDRWLEPMWCRNS